MFGSTVFTRTPGIRQYQPEVFWSWKEILGIGTCGRLGSTTGDGLLQENLLNILLLFPAGILLPGLTGRKLKWWMGLLVGIAVSSAIEISQLLLCRGLFEFDDIIHNSLGCMLGCLLGNRMLRLVHEK
ncbi:VanZ family protein [Blautia wexlerae]|uniref:VanZ family protein n=1 Tax=Blautia TaxID=572511 RepID=UPI003B50029F